MKDSFLSTTVVLPVISVMETVELYEKKLGFEIMGIWGNPTNASKYGSVRRDNVIIEFGEGRKEYAGNGVCLIHVGNADNIYSELKSNCIEFVGDFADRDYGNKDFRVRDNNGNMLIIGHSLNNQKELLQKHKIA